MTEWTSIYKEQSPTSVTFAQPIEEASFADVFSAATRVQRNRFSENAALEEAYDAQIKQYEDATGAKLENPVRDGYRIDARNRVRQDVIAGGMAPIDEKGGIPAYQRRIFDEKVAELRARNPDLPFGSSIEDDARAIERKNVAELARVGKSDMGAIPYYAAQFAGSMYGDLRNPLFLGSLFLGGGGATAEMAVARIAQEALSTSLFNAGTAALETKGVQDWRARTGQETGVWPAVEDIGMAALLGAIPGAGIGIAKEVAGPLVRLLRGRPEPGDIAKVQEHTPIQPSAASAMKAAEDAIEADKVALADVPRSEGVSPDLHDDMLGAALKRADDPDEPSPAAVMAVDSIDRPAADLPEPVPPEVAQALKEAAPQTLREAHEVADDALDDIGRSNGAAIQRETLEAGRQARQERATKAAEAPRVERASDDPLEKVPWVDSSGKPQVFTERTLAQIDEKESRAAMLVRSCK